MELEIIWFMTLNMIMIVKCQHNADQNNFDTNNTEPKYTYSYGVNDDETGDVKSIWEVRDGRSVRGHYSVLDQNGSTRTVEYTAGPKKGFEGIVKTENKGKEYLPNFEKKSIRDYGKFQSLWDLPTLQSNLKYDSKDYNPKFNFETKYKLFPFSNKHYMPDYYDKPYMTESMPDSENSYTTIKLPKNKSKYNKEHIDDIYSKVVEIDLTKNFKHLTYTPGKEYKINLNEDNEQNTYDNSYTEGNDNEPSNIDMQKLLSPFTINGHFKMPNLIETRFQPASSAFIHKQHNYEPAANLDLYELTPTSHFNDIYSEVEHKHSKKKPNSKKQYVKPDLYHYTTSNSDDFMVLPKKRYRNHMKIVNPNFEYTSYLPPDYTKANVDEEFTVPHYALDYETIHIPQDDRFSNVLNRGIRDKFYSVRSAGNKRERRPVNTYHDYSF